MSLITTKAVCCLSEVCKNPGMPAGTKDDPWELSTAPRTSTYAMWVDETADPPTLFCQVGSTQLRYGANAATAPACRNARRVGDIRVVSARRRFGTSRRARAVA